MIFGGRRRGEAALFLGVLALVLFPMTKEGEAAEIDLVASAVLRAAMIGLGPTPGASLLSSSQVEWLDDQIREHAWPMPTQRTWPLNDQGQPIVETRRVDEWRHRLKPGESLRRLRSIYRLTTRQLQELNPEVDLGELEVGQEVLVWKRSEEGVTESRGQPQAGRLIRGEPMPESEDYILLYPYRSFGTYYTVSETVRVLDAYYQTYPQAAPLIVGDISFRSGRRINPHKSHQAGRDVDITLPRLEEPPDYRRFHHIRRDNLDGERALSLLTSIIQGGYVQYVFLDWYHQRTLWQLAKEQGAPQEWLDEVFQYPRRSGPGIVRHASGHRGHLHVRFHCQQTDRWCR